jgi:hypothetical protein
MANRYSKSDRAGKKRGLHISKIFSDRPPLPDDQEVLLSVIATSPTLPKKLHDENGQHQFRPTLIWGLYFDDHGVLKGFDGIDSTSQEPRENSRSFFLRKLGSHIKETYLITSNIRFFRNRNQHCPNPLSVPMETRGTIHDLILRRAFSIVAAPVGTKHSRYRRQNYRDLSRHGVVFNSLSQADVRSGFFAPDVHDTPFPQVPFIPEGTSQYEIDLIGKSVKEYFHHARSQGQRVRLPHPGLWPHWPLHLMGGPMPAINPFRKRSMSANPDRLADAAISEMSR